MNERYVRCGGAVQRFCVFSVAVTCVIATAFWTPPATGEEDHGTNGDAAEKHAGGENHEFKTGFALCLGGTNEQGHGTEPTWGLEDARKLSPRLGAAQWFHIGRRYGLAPAVNVDFVDGHEVWIYGVNFEVMF